MATQTKENYLKAIYFLELHQAKVTLSAIGEKMEVSAPTANSMVRKLEKKGWLKYQKYKPIKLSKKGRVEAALIIRKHRLTEMFLTKVMGFGWEEVHDIAEEMEHLQNESFFDRMDEILGFPTIDPHGSPIPNKAGETTKKKYQKLSERQAGESARLVAVNDSSVELLVLLNEKDIKLGTEFNIIKIEPYDGTMEVNYDRHKGVTLSREVCSRLLIEG